ncbi:PhzF family phenazine biosynthesis protein [Cellulomonas aerilata]|uniref:Putative isomerase n=1 Tax=Cellulomonas aerilata TaxID=515326 RepID=A0A512DGH4_9CELL|nr:PhzF family phenazine biosynthesis protein [Cellulomonas aerilata]GEO35290.1 putative isomerase [Cellulomonas aerilata]
MQVPLLQIDAFAERPFEGNPAAVMPLPHWPSDVVLQQVAAENNLSETAFVVAALPDGVSAPDASLPALHLRWFTPATEVDLCGHATLATGAHLLQDVHPDAATVQLFTRSGWLLVHRDPDGGYTMDLPSVPLTRVDVDPVVQAALGVPVLEAWAGMDLVLVVRDAATVAALQPDLAALAGLPVRGVVVTAPGTGTGFDLVSRWFGGEAGIAEDPVTGSAHCQIGPLWAQRLGSDDLVARQLSARGGTVRVAVRGDRTLLTGTCVRYLTGTAVLPD